MAHEVDGEPCPWWQTVTREGSPLFNIQKCWRERDYVGARRIIDEDDSHTIPHECVSDVSALVNKDYIMTWTEEKGRGLVAARDFQIGETVLSERPILRGVCGGDASRRVFSERYIFCHFFIQ